MMSRAPHSRNSPPDQKPFSCWAAAIARKTSLLLIMTHLLVLPVLLIPRAATMAPSIHSKELGVRVLLAFLAVALLAAWPHMDRRRLRPVEWALVAFMGAHVLASLFSGRFLYCLLETWHLWVIPGLALVIPRLSPTAGTLRAAALVIATAAGLTAAYGFLVYTGLNPVPDLFPYAHDQEGRSYMHSFLGNPEYFGSYMAPVAVLCVSLALRRNASAAAVTAWTGAALVFLLAIALSGTRGAFMSFGLAAIVVAADQGRRLGQVARRRALIALVAILIAGVVGTVILSTSNPINRRDMRLAQRFVELFDLNSSSVRERILFYSLSGNMIAQNPVFGSGPGTYKLEYFPAVDRLIEADPRAGVTIMMEDLQNRVAEHAHNDYLEFWAETGTVGFAALLLVLTTAGWRYGSGFRRQIIPPSPSDRAADSVNTLRTGYFATALCLFTNALFSFPLHLPARATLAWAALGFFLAADQLATQSTAPDDRPRQNY